jgi:hypothetical protein
VRDVGAVEPFALLDERLRPHHLFDRTQSDGQLEDVIGAGVFEPLIVDPGDAVARAVDHIHEILAAVRFAQPVREPYFGLIACRAQRRQRPFEISGPDEHVEVLGMALDARVASEGIRSANQDVEVGLLERAQRGAVERPGLGFENLQPWLGSGHIFPWRCGKGRARGPAQFLLPCADRWQT